MSIYAASETRGGDSTPGAVPVGVLRAPVVESGPRQPPCVRSSPPEGTDDVMKGIEMAEILTVKRRGYRVSEVAEMLGIDPKTVRRAIDSDALIAHRCGSVVLIFPADLDAWISNFERTGGAV